jgi:uncharacterized protein (TIGR02646 family)
MKYIRKTGAPHSYTQWCAEVRGTAKENFNELRMAEKTTLLEALIREQGALCAYTMRRIGKGTSHVEHIKPQSLCRADLAGSDLDYGNLVACFPRNGMNPEYCYGARQKDNWWKDDGKDFVSPLHPSCERRFRFNLAGKIEAVDDDVSAVTTIKVLKLDHESLTDDRARVINEFLYGVTGRDPLSAAQATKLQASACNARGLGEFIEFCVAIRHALEDYLCLLQKLTQKRKFARRQG